MKLSNLKLLGILGLLVGVYALFEIFGGNNRSENFRKELVKYENDKVDKMIIQKSGKSIELRKSGTSWMLKTETGKEVEPISSKIDNALAMLKEAKPSRIVAKKQEKWKDYEVDDSTGVRVQLFAESEKVVDIILGKFTPVQRAGTFAFSSFVRLADETEVYNCEDFMASSFPSKSADFRDINVLKFNRDSLVELSLIFPADSSFVLLKKDDKWTIDGQEVDNEKVTAFINDINYTTSPDFEDEFQPNALGKETFTLVAKEKGGNSFTVMAFSHPDKKWLLTSSLNPKVVFSDAQSSLIDKMFKKGKNHFLDTKEETKKKGK
ncbi:MAG: DUF4340 domain-containing protein [Flammeovirgaceae bacterium]